MFTRRVAVLLTVIALSGPASYAQETGSAGEAQAAEKITYDHAGTNHSVTYERKLKVGEQLAVVIENTCSDSFVYGVTAIPRAEEERERFLRDAERFCTRGTKTVNIVHERQNGGYIIDVQPKPGAVTRISEDVNLNAVQIVIHVVTEKWEAELSGGFSITGLTDPRFGLVTKKVGVTDPATGATTETDQNFVVRDRGAEDDSRLGVGSFLHVYHSKLPWLAGTFGLGVNEANRTTYFTGLSWRWGDAGALTGGYAWGSVDRLPAGTRFDEPVQANLLSNLGTRTDGDWFISFSYKFLGSKDFFEKPLKPVAAGSDETKGKKASEDKTGEVSKGGAVILPRPESFEATGGCQRAILKWKALSAATSYRIYRGTKADCSDLKEVGKSDKSETPTFEDKNLDKDKKFFYAVRAFNGELGDRTDCEPAETTCKGEDP